MQSGLSSGLIAAVISVILLVVLVVTLILVYAYYRRKMRLNPPFLWSSVNPDYMASAPSE